MPDGCPVASSDGLQVCVVSYPGAGAGEGNRRRLSGPLFEGRGSDDVTGEKPPNTTGARGDRINSMLEFQCVGIDPVSWVSVEIGFRGTRPTAPDRGHLEESGADTQAQPEPITRPGWGGTGRSGLQALPAREKAGESW
ncbi:hypothetical protein GCM10023191_070240 [Actinoallomurus oryzae]|uniref:Uncharacterized protein n=1 Tax=Actinoallomurus oryzae TaxID=502180 RepID=A0ABP8QR79_9ACTN